jgi:hypothetical protein
VTLPYLYAHQNRHAPKRTNGRRFWGYPTRSQKVRLIGIHTTESTFDLIGQDTGAEGVAAFQSRTDRPSSYHRIVDRDSTVVCLPDEATAFGIGNLNSPTLHLAFALRAADWSDPKKAAAARPMLERGADEAARWCRQQGIPLTWLTRSQAFDRSRGFIRHGTADPDRRSDPGEDFPARLFFELIATRLDPKPAPTVQEDEMKLYVFTHQGLDWGTDLMARRPFEDQSVKATWIDMAQRLGHTVERITLEPDEIEALPAVGVGL